MGDVVDISKGRLLPNREELKQARVGFVLNELEKAKALGFLHRWWALINDTRDSQLKLMMPIVPDLFSSTSSYTYYEIHVVQNDSGDTFGIYLVKPTGTEKADTVVKSFSLKAPPHALVSVLQYCEWAYYTMLPSAQASVERQEQYDRSFRGSRGKSTTRLEDTPPRTA